MKKLFVYSQQIRYSLIESYAMKQCFFCSQNIKEIDYKETELLKRFISGQTKIIDPKFTGICAKHQRRLAKAIKRARILGLLPFVRR